MKNSLSIRPCFYDDEEIVLEIMNQGISSRSNAFIEPFDWIQGAKWFKSLRESSIRLVVCEFDGKVVGWASLSDYREARPALSKVKEITFYVHQDFHRQGVATKMIDHLEQECNQLDIEHLAAILLSDNSDSRALLEKKGYFVFGLFEGVAKFNEHNAGHLYMGKHLNTHR
ncbi:GNAT family N-acetyltransferase [Salibacteraceae bacterium]|nr:GNAT family N-acetyltransferase [Salibacteraceae bacterium]